MTSGFGHCRPLLLLEKSCSYSWRRGRSNYFASTACYYRETCAPQIASLPDTMDNLREHVMINQFVLAAGCDRESAARCLTQSEWQFQTALSIYFQEATVPKTHGGYSLLTPANTPATPPNFPDALTMFSNMSTSDKGGTSLTGPNLSPRGVSTSHTPHHLSPRSRQPQPPQSPQPPQQSQPQQSQGGFPQPIGSPMRGAIVIDNDRDPHQSLGGDDHLQFPFGSPGTLGHFPGEQSTDTGQTMGVKNTNTYGVMDCDDF